MGLGRFFNSACTVLVATTFLGAPLARAQDSINSNIYDDYSAFESDPVQLDEEVSRYFGRFFQTNFLIGTGLFTGDLGAANSAGFNLGLRFVFYFDKMWGGELGLGYYGHKTTYNSENTNTANIDVSMDTVMIPVSLGIRYAFDRDNLPRGISLMNPYLALNGEIVFRSEGVKGSPTTGGIDASVRDKFAAGSVVSTTAFGASIGGGFEFDVYKNTVFLGLDVRYHILFWPDADTLVGSLGRDGNYFTVLGMVSYNY
ncbi:MAG: outer membrane beta-barrel protein [Bdellovibrionota bacterium]